MIRVAFVLLALAIFLPGVGADEPSVADLERDLALEAWLTSESTIAPGEPVRLGARITNRSSSRTYAVVRPGDGSECGWREPHVYYTALSYTPRGVAIPVEARDLARCGNYDADWTKGVVTLEPGASIDLTQHLLAADTQLDFQREGSVRIRFHYAWTGGRAHKGGPGEEPPADLGAMEGVPPFELVSNAVDLSVVRPVEVSLDVIDVLPVGRVRTLDQLVRVTVHNRTEAAIDFTAQQLHFLVGQTDPTDLLDLRDEVPPKARVRAAPLRPGEKRTYAGAANFQLLRHLRLRAREAGTVEMAVVYAPGTTERGPGRSRVRIRSPWVTIRATPDDS